MIKVIIFSLLLFAGVTIAQETTSYAGEYQLKPGFIMTITIEDDGLYVEATGKPKEKLEQLSNSQYKIPSNEGIIDFNCKVTDGVAVVHIFDRIFHAPLLPISEEIETFEEIEIDPAAFKKYEGTYRLSPEAVLEVKAKEECLYAKLTGQAEFQVFPYAENKFFYRVTEASLEFVESINDDPDYVLLHQGGVILQLNKE